MQVVQSVLFYVGTHPTSHSNEKAFFTTMPKPMKANATVRTCKLLQNIITVYAVSVMKEPSTTALLAPAKMGKRDIRTPAA